MKIELAPIDSIIPYINNPRKNTDSAITKVAASIKEFGWQQAIVVGADMVIIAGHTRFLAAKKLGLTEVPIKIADNLTDAQIKAYRINDNRSAQESLWDEELLKIEMESLQELGADLDITGFDPEEIEKLFKEIGVEDEPSDKELEPTFEVVVECKNEREQQKVFDLLQSQGYKCKPLSL